MHLRGPPSFSSSPRPVLPAGFCLCAFLFLVWRARTVSSTYSTHAEHLLRDWHEHTESLSCCRDSLLFNPFYQWRKPSDYCHQYPNTLLFLPSFLSLRNKKSLTPIPLQLQSHFSTWNFLKAVSTYNFTFFNFFFFLPHCTGRWDLSSWQGIKPAPSALEAWCLNHWAAREVPIFSFFPLIL